MVKPIFDLTAWNLSNRAVLANGDYETYFAMMRAVGHDGAGARPQRLLQGSHVHIQGAVSIPVQQGAGLRFWPVPLIGAMEPVRAVGVGREQFPDELRFIADEVVVRRVGAIILRRVLARTG